MHLSNKNLTCLKTTRINCRNVRLIISLIFYALSRVALCVALIISRFDTTSSSSIANEYKNPSRSSIRIVDKKEKWAQNIVSTFSFVVVATLVLVRNDNMMNSMNVLAIAFLTHFVILKRLLMVFFDACIWLRNSSRLCLLRILLFLSHVRTYVSHSREVQHCRRNILIFLIIFVHFVVHLDLALSCGLAHEVKSSIAFSRTSSSLVVYSLMSPLSTRLFNNDLGNMFFNMLSNFFRFMAF